MQGQSSTIKLDQGSSSSNSSIDPQVYWSSVLNPMDTRDIADCLLPSDDNMMPYTNVVNPESGSFTGWNFNAPESNQSASNQVHLEETKRGHEWTSPVASSSSTSTRLHEGRFEAGNMLSLDNAGINIVNDQIHSGQEYNSLQNTVYTTETNNCNGQPSAHCHLLNSRGHDTQWAKSGVGSTNSCSTSAGNRVLPEDQDGRPQCSIDGLCGSGKRKNIEGVFGQSSTNGMMTYLHQGENSQQTTSLGNNSVNSGLSISSSSTNPVTGTVQGISPTPVSVSRGLCNPLSSVSAVGNSESTNRNVRRRTSPALENDLFLSNLWPPGNPARHANILPPHQTSVVIPYVPLPEVPPVSTSASQSHSSIPTIPLLPQNSRTLAWNSTSNSRADNASSSPMVSVDRFASRRSVRSIPVPVTDMRHLVQDPTNWNLSTGSMNPLGSIAATSRAGLNSASSSSVPPTWPSHQIPLVQHTLRSSDHSRHSLPSIVSDSGVQRSHVRVQDPSHSSSPQESLPNPATALRSQQRHLLRSALLMDRQIDGLPGIPLPRRMTALREGGRSRVITEQIRTALDVLCRGLPYEFVRGDNLRFETLMFGGVDFHDRHRDMRLDVDNMSYEELLALEERIGNVNIGLTEETVMKHLKLWKYTANPDEASQDVEPCCICREEYAQDEDLGTLHCGHIFHSQCIKQWLSYKNICPICKTTALNT